MRRFLSRDEYHFLRKIATCKTKNLTGGWKQDNVVQIDINVAHGFMNKRNGFAFLRAGIIPLFKKQLLYNKRFPVSEQLARIDSNDSQIVDSFYDNIIAPLIEEILFALVPILLFPGSLVAFICFRTVFLLLHMIEKNEYGRLTFASLSINKIFIPFIVSAVSIISNRFDVALVSHVLINAFITPLINRVTGNIFRKAAIGVTFLIRACFIERR
jgi:hypothetical protein